MLKHGGDKLKNTPKNKVLLMNCKIKTIYLKINKD